VENIVDNEELKKTDSSNGNISDDIDDWRWRQLWRRAKEKYSRESEMTEMILKGWASYWKVAIDVLMTSGMILLTENDWPVIMTWQENGNEKSY